MGRLLEVDPSIGQTRFHWLRSAPEAPAASNLVGLTERIAFLRRLEIDPELQARVSSGRWDQMIREGNATPAWLASDFNASRRQALIVAQVIKLCQKLTDDAVQAARDILGQLNHADLRALSPRGRLLSETERNTQLFVDQKGRYWNDPSQWQIADRLAQMNDLLHFDLGEVARQHLAGENGLRDHMLNALEVVLRHDLEGFLGCGDFLDRKSGGDG
ncbi:hypothetical protein ATY29_08675 [Rhizobium hidalgonense]|nr:hypothetical protein ATY29_08675 [Rhizobium hidalgonense]